MKRPAKKRNNNLRAKAKTKRKATAREREREKAQRWTNKQPSSSCFITKIFNYLQIVGVGVVLIVWRAATVAAAGGGAVGGDKSVLFAIVRAFVLHVQLYIVIGHLWERHRYCPMNYSLPNRWPELFGLNWAWNPFWVKISHSAAFTKRNFSINLFAIDGFNWADKTTFCRYAWPNAREKSVVITTVIPYCSRQFIVIPRIPSNSRLAPWFGSNA